MGPFALILFASLGLGALVTSLFGSDDNDNHHNPDNPDIPEEENVQNGTDGDDELIGSSVDDIMYGG